VKSNYVRSTQEGLLIYSRCVPRLYRLDPYTNNILYERRLIGMKKKV